MTTHTFTKRPGFISSKLDCSFLNLAASKSSLWRTGPFFDISFCIFVLKSWYSCVAWMHLSKSFIEKETTVWKTRIKTYLFDKIWRIPKSISATPCSFTLDLEINWRNICSFFTCNDELTSVSLKMFTNYPNRMLIFCKKICRNKENVKEM